MNDSPSFKLLVCRARSAARPALTMLAGLIAVVATAGGSGAFDAKGDAEEAAKVRTAMQRTQSVNKLKQLALAMHNYHTVKGRFPPAAIYDKDGKALLSWRVILLPYLDEKKLGDEFRLDEAWDSEHNKKLLERMPKVFDVDLDGKKPGETVYVGLVGEGAVFDGKKGVRLQDITDGTSNTILFVESARPVPWTKPEDLPFDAAKPLPKFRRLGVGFNAAFCDGSVRFISASVPQKTLNALITRSGGEKLDD
jgi:prepilin-type processing-associated H-X9-DG protein